MLSFFCFVLGFFVWKIHFTFASKMCPSHPRHVGKTHFVRHQDIYIFISRVIVNESNQAQQAGQRLDAAGDWRPANCGRVASDPPTSYTGTRAIVSSITNHPARCHSVPLFLPLLHHTLFFSRRREREEESRGRRGGRQPRSCHGALILQQLFFLFLLFSFS